MAQGGEGRWVTIKGRRVFIQDGETPSEAIERSKRNSALYGGKRGRMGMQQDEIEQGMVRIAQKSKSYQDDQARQKAVTELQKNTLKSIKKQGMEPWKAVQAAGRRAMKEIKEKEYMRHGNNSDMITPTKREMKNFKGPTAKRRGEQERPRRRGN